MRQILIVITILLLTATPSVASDSILGLAVKIVMCESGGRHDAIGDDGVSRGIAQFRRETFYEFAKLAGYKNARWESAIDQWNLLIWGLQHGYAKRWTCADVKVREYQRKRQIERTLKRRR